MDNKNENTEFKTFNGEVTPEQISAWKAQHGRIHEVELTDEEMGEKHIGYFRRPDMKTMQAFSATAKTNEIKAVEVLFNNCWLGGSPMMKSDAVYQLQANGELQKIFGTCVAKLKNL